MPPASTSAASRARWSPRSSLSPGRAEPLPALFAVARPCFLARRGAGAAPGLSVSPGTAAALVALAFNTATPLLLTAALPAFRRLCARLAPPLEEEDLGKPQFLHEEVGANAVATLLLAEQEQLRLLRRMPAYMAWSRGEAAAKAGPTPRPTIRPSPRSAVASSASRARADVPAHDGRGHGMAAQPAEAAGAARGAG